MTDWLDAGELDDARARVLENLGVLAQVGDPALQRIARLAATVAGAPHAAVHVFDADLQHRVGAFAAPLDATPRDDTLCRVAVDEGTAVITADATADDRFTGSPFVTGDDPVRFYAAAPLRSLTDVPIGTLCVWSGDAREVDPALLDSLADLAQIVVDGLESARLSRLSSEAARTDALTGLANRRMLFEHLHERYDASAPDAPALTAVVVDLDRFKAVNDELGHEAGDEVLRTVARRLREELPEGVLHARIGGDEFVCVLDRDVVAVDDATAAIRAAIEAPIETSSGEVSVGASLGVADAEGGDAPDVTLRRADLAMFVTKRGGGNFRLAAR